MWNCGKWEELGRVCARSEASSRSVKGTHQLTRGVVKSLLSLPKNPPSSFFRCLHARPPPTTVYFHLVFSYLPILYAVGGCTLCMGLSTWLADHTSTSIRITLSRDSFLLAFSFPTHSQIKSGRLDGGKGRDGRVPFLQRIQQVYVYPYRFC
jgi:hypothetical protein